MSGVGGIERSGGDRWDASAVEPAAAAESTAETAGLASELFRGNATLAGIASGRGAIGYNAREREAARCIQRALIDLGFLGAEPGADGIFGRRSVQAVMAFQRSVGLRADGIVGPRTLRALDEKLAGRTSGSAPAAPAAPVPPPAGMRVVEGTSDYSLDDDTLVMTGEGQWTSTLKRDIYAAGYLPRTEGPLFNPLGTRAPTSPVLSEADNKLNAERSPVERFDEAMRRATGTAGKLADRYKIEGKQPEAKSWWGYCDRWAYNALDPEVATRVNKPILLNGVYFSTAELRGLATFLGRADESGGLFDTDVTPLDLQKAVTVFLKDNGPGFIGDVWLDRAHPSDPQVWNQPFDGVEQKVRELKGAELEKVLKDQFGLTGAAAAGKRIFYVETTGHYGVESGEEYEGPASHSSKTWKSWILTEPNGKATEGKWAPGSADALEYIWRPNRTGVFTGEAKFLRDLLKRGVPVERVKSFEHALSRLPTVGGLSDAQKADLRAQFAGIAAAYPEATLAAKLAPYGLGVADFR